MMSPPVENRKRKLDRAYLFQNGFVALVAATFVISAASFFIDPTDLRTTIGEQHPYDYYWNIFYLAGGLAVLIGLLTVRVAVEVAGHILLTPAVATNAILSMAVLGVHRVTLLTTMFGLAAVFRAAGLLMGWQETTQRIERFQAATDRLDE